MLRFLTLVAAYIGTTAYALAFITAPDQVTLFWPAAGVGFAAALAWGNVGVWGVAVAVFLIHITGINAVPPAFIPFSVISNALATWLAMRYANSRHFDYRFGLQSGLHMLRAALLMCIVSALIGVLGLVQTRMIPPDDWLSATVRWIMGDLLGAIAFTPALLVLADAFADPNRKRTQADLASLAEKWVWAALFLGSFFLVYFGAVRESRFTLALLAVPVSLQLWAALRFEAVWTTCASAVTVTVLTTFTGLGMSGFYAPEGAIDSAILLLFLCMLALMPMIIASASHERVLATRRLLKRATTDEWTGLSNRAAFEQEASQLMRSHHDHATLVYFDLDQLALVNDTVSHAAGDALIKGVASLLRAHGGDRDRIYRIGGDEFALLSTRDDAEAERHTRDLLRSIESYRVGWNDHILSTTASAGLTHLRPHKSDFAAALAMADAACFTAKELGGNRLQIADTASGQVDERTQAMRWAMRIRQALDRGLFEIDCQRIGPLSEQADQRVHFEVLLRMRDPQTDERLMPGSFIPAAERFRLGTLIDRHVVDLCFAALEARPQLHERIGTCAINLTAGSMVDEGFAEYLHGKVSRAAFPAAMLCFEITETSAVLDLARAQKLIGELRSLGCRFALDDFGTGFCSFSYLRELDVDYLKIDGSFIRELRSSPLSAAVVRSITEIAHVLRKQTIAEHTEDRETCDALREWGVDYAQGYAIHRPEPVFDFFRTLGQAAEP